MYVVVEDTISGKTRQRKHKVSTYDGGVAVMAHLRREADRTPNPEFERDIWLEDEDGTLLEWEFAVVDNTGGR